jgi:nicotinate phosphoribosyltransferase
MGVSADAPWSDIAYKLVEYDNRPVLKLSPEKVSLPGRKQVARIYDSQGRLEKDLIALRGESIENAEPLLKKVMTKGKITAPLPSLEEIRSVFSSEFSRLPERIKAIRNASHYRVEQSAKLAAHRAVVEQQVSRSQ